MPYAEISYAFKISDHAHNISGSITLIQMLQPDAGEAVTAKTVLRFVFHHLLAVLDLTCDTVFWFEAVVTQATGARILISRECTAEAAVHSAGSY